VNVEEQLIDTLVSDDGWGAKDWLDPVGRITSAYRRRRRRRLAGGVSASVAVTALAAIGIVHVQAGGNAVVQPAGPTPPVVTSSSPATTEQQDAAAAVQRAQQQAAAAAAAARTAAGRCPKSPQSISTGMRGQAFEAVVSYNQQRDPRFSRSTLRRDRVTLASTDGERGGEVTTACGPFTAARTFVVYTTRTDLLPSASLSQGVYFVSRTDGGLAVWEQAH
jgi:hypothetical protein